MASKVQKNWTPLHCSNFIHFTQILSLLALIRSISILFLLCATTFSFELALLSVWNVLCISDLLSSSFSTQVRCHLLREASPKSPHIFPSIISPVHISSVLLLIHLFSCCQHQNKSSMRIKITNHLFTIGCTQQGYGMNNFRGH